MYFPTDKLLFFIVQLYIKYIQIIRGLLILSFFQTIQKFQVCQYRLSSIEKKAQFGKTQREELNQIHIHKALFKIYSRSLLSCSQRKKWEIITQDWLGAARTQTPLPQIMTQTQPLGPTLGWHPSKVQWRSPTQAMGLFDHPLIPSR